MVERQLPKLHTRVRFPSPAPRIDLQRARQGPSVASGERAAMSLETLRVLVPELFGEGVRRPRWPSPRQGLSTWSCCRPMPLRCRRLRRRAAAATHRPRRSARACRGHGAGGGGRGRRRCTAGRVAAPGRGRRDRRAAALARLRRAAARRRSSGAASSARRAGPTPPTSPPACRTASSWSSTHEPT